MIQIAWYDSDKEGIHKSTRGRFPAIHLDENAVKKRFLELIDRKSNYITVLAREFCVSKPTMKRTLSKLNLNRKVLYDPKRPFNATMIRRYVEQKESHEVIGKAMGVNPETVRKRLLRMGIKSRGVGFANYNYIGSPKRPDLTGYQLNELIKQTYEQCWSVKGVMLKLGLGDLETVRRRLRRMGYDTTHRKGFSLRFKRRNNKIVKLYKKDHSLKYIAWKMGLSATTISNWLDKSGVRKKGENMKPISLIEKCEMIPDHPDVKEAKRIAYWYLKGFKMEDVSMIEDIPCQKVSRSLRRLGINTKRMQSKKYIYSDHQKNLLLWVLSNRSQYRSKINKLINDTEKQMKRPYFKPKGEFAKLLSGLFPKASPTSRGEASCKKQRVNHPRKIQNLLIPCRANG